MKFRYAREAPEESGAGSETEVEETPEHVSVFSDPSRWDAVNGDEPAVAEEEVTPEEGGDDPPVAAPAEESRKLAGKYDSPEDLEKAYIELQRKLGAPRETAPPAEEEPEAEEPASWRAHNFSSLGAIPTTGLSVQQRTELGELMGIDPEAAAHWAVANSHLLREDEFAAVQNTWAQADQWAYQKFWQGVEQQRREQRETEEYGPRMDVVDTQRRKEGVIAAKEALPAIVEHEQAFKAWLESTPELDDYLGAMTDPEQVKNAVIGAFYQFYGPYQLTKSAEEQASAAAAAEAAKVEQAAQEAAAETSNRKARTATRSAPAAPAGGEASPDDIREAIRAARR